MPILNFKGKTFVQNHHLTVPYHQLIPVKEKSLTDKVSLHDNLIIHGDNLKALKALLPTYAGKVKCICIDPPYNTGGEGWVYNDNVNSPYMKEWLGKIVDKDDLTRHDKWLCMMIPRLKIIKELLNDKGVLFVHIDNNEINNLITILDDIFDESNFVGVLIWRKKEGGGQTDSYFVTEHEYIIVYAKSSEFKWLDEEIEIKPEDYKFKDKDGNYSLVKLAKWGNAARQEDRPKMSFPIIAPDGKKVMPKAPDGNPGRWRVGKTTMEDLIENKLIHFEKINDEWNAYEKVYYKPGKMRIIKERSILYDIASTGDASVMLTGIFGKKDVFSNPKPIELEKFFIQYTTDKESIILDSFAGSGTTAHAVLDLNKEDGGNRKFILVEMEDYADKITAERIRRVIKGVKKSVDEDLKIGLGGTFSYFELGDAIEHESILHGKKMPSYKELARYVFYTATGEEFNDKKIKKDLNFIGNSKDYDIYMYYEPDVEKLKRMAFTLDMALNLPKSKKKRLVFAPTKFIDNDTLQELKIDFCQLPFEIYRMKK